MAKHKTQKTSEWLDIALKWFNKQLEKWYGPFVAIVGLPLLFIFTLISWPVRVIISHIKESIKE